MLEVNAFLEDVQHKIHNERTVLQTAGDYEEFLSTKDQVFLDYSLTHIWWNETPVTGEITPHTSILPTPRDGDDTPTATAHTPISPRDTVITTYEETPPADVPDLIQDHEVDLDFHTSPRFPLEPRPPLKPRPPLEPGPPAEPHSPTKPSLPPRPFEPRRPTPEPIRPPLFPLPETSETPEIFSTILDYGPMVTPPLTPSTPHYGHDFGYTDELPEATETTMYVPSFPVDITPEPTPESRPDFEEITEVPDTHQPTIDQPPTTPTYGSDSSDYTSPTPPWTPTFATMTRNLKINSNISSHVKGVMKESGNFSAIDQYKWMLKPQARLSATRKNHKQTIYVTSKLKKRLLKIDRRCLSTF